MGVALGGLARFRDVLNRLIGRGLLTHSEGKPIREEGKGFREGF